MFVVTLTPKRGLEPDSSVKAFMAQVQTAHAAILPHSSFKLNASQKHRSVLYSVHSAGGETSSYSSRSGTVMLLSCEVSIKTVQAHFSFTKKKERVSNTYPRYRLARTPAIPLNVTGSAERSVDAKGSEAQGSILHHFSQLGHIYSPQVIVHLRVILSVFLASLQMRRGPAGRGETERDKDGERGRGGRE